MQCKAKCAARTNRNVSAPYKFSEEKEFAMPNPKRRHSKARTAKRRAHDALTATGSGECPSCHERKLPHRACPKCGTYKGRAVLDVKEPS